MELRFLPSRLLYQLDRDAYVELLDSVPTLRDAEPDRDARAEDEAPPPAYVSTTTTSVQPSIVEHYTGRYESLKDALFALLESQGVRQPRIPRLADSVLATVDDTAVLDWTAREPMRARVLVALKRVAKAVGPKQPPPEALASLLLQWFVEQEHILEQTARRQRRKTAKEESEP